MQAKEDWTIEKCAELNARENKLQVMPQKIEVMAVRKTCSLIYNI